MAAAQGTTPNRQGWVIVGLCFLALSASFSARSMLGLAMPLWEADLGWSRSFVSTGGALTLVMMAIVAPVAGLMVFAIREDRGPAAVPVTAPAGG